MKRISTALAALCLFTPTLSEAQETVFLIRHAEKAAGEDPGLTDAGRARAARWAEMLDGNGIAAVITTTATRTRETGDIIAGALGVGREEVAMSDTAGVVDLIEFDYADAPVLVVGHTETLPSILSGLGEGTPPDLDQSDFGNLFVARPGEGLVARLRMPEM